MVVSVVLAFVVSHLGILIGNDFKKPTLRAKWILGAKLEWTNTNLPISIWNKMIMQKDYYKYFFNGHEVWIKIIEINLYNYIAEFEIQFSNGIYCRSKLNLEKGFLDNKEKTGILKELSGLEKTLFELAFDNNVIVTEPLKLI